METTVILTGKRLEDFCQELNIDSSISKIIVRINNKRAEYYNFVDDCFYELDLEIAKKYLN